MGAWSVGSSVSILHLQRAWGVGVGVSVAVLEDDRRPAHACHWGVTSVPALRPQSSAPASPQTPTAHPSEVSVLWARGTAQRLCPALGPHPRNAKTLPPPQRHPALRTRGHQGLPCRCCIVSVSVLPPPLVFLLSLPSFPSLLLLLPLPSSAQ